MPRHGYLDGGFCSDRSYNFGCFRLFVIQQKLRLRNLMRYGLWRVIKRKLVLQTPRKHTESQGKKHL